MNATIRRAGTWPTPPLLDDAEDLVDILGGPSYDSSGHGPHIFDLGAVVQDANAERRGVVVFEGVLTAIVRTWDLFGPEFHEIEHGSRAWVVVGTGWAWHGEPDAGNLYAARWELDEFGEEDADDG